MIRGGQSLIRRRRYSGADPQSASFEAADGERSRVVAAVNLGVNEFLVKPVSTKALLARLVSLIANPRPMVRIGDYYGPEPRQLSSLKPETDVAWV